MEAFGTVEIPQFEDLLAPRFRNSEDPLELAAVLRDKHWRDVAVRDLLRHRESLATLSGIGYRAYIAAYLLASLDEGDDAADLLEYTLFSLGPITEAESDVNEATARLSALDPAQRAAVRGWLEHQQGNHKLAHTLLARWSLA